jgi:hypothetical protein
MTPSGWTGFDLAYAAAAEGYRLSLDVGHGSGWHLMNMAMVEAVRGDDNARSHAEEALSIGQRSHSAFLVGYAEKTLGFLDLTLGRADQAADRLLALTTPGGPAFNETPADPAGFHIARRLQALPDAPAVVLTSSHSRRRFGSQLGHYPFVAKADLCARALSGTGGGGIRAQRPGCQGTFGHCESGCGGPP